MGKQIRQKTVSKKFMTGVEHKVRKPDHFTVRRTKNLAQVELFKNRPNLDSTIEAPTAKDDLVKKQPNHNQFEVQSTEVKTWFDGGEDDLVRPSK